jgi:hypothetical protein
MLSSRFESTRDDVDWFLNPHQLGYFFGNHFDVIFPKALKLYLSGHR